MQIIQHVASQIALRAHNGQFYGGVESGIPYYEHLYDVVSNVTEMYEEEYDAFQEDSSLQAAAWLHDIIEDCGFNQSLLYGSGMTKEVVDIVVAVTKLEGETQEVYLNRIVEAGPNAIKLKLADSRANLSATLSSPVSETQQRRLEKYTSNLVFLNQALLNLA